MSRTYVAGHAGMAGSAIVRALERRGGMEIIRRSHAELDLTDPAAVRAFMQAERPARVVIAAARVGGIHANNTYPAEFIYSNLMVEANLIHEGWRAGVRELLFLGSSCIYPRMAAQPMREDALLTGPLEPTNEPYAIAKISGIKLCQAYRRQYGCDFVSAMPTNLYGPGDNYHAQDSHVIPGLIRRFHEAKVAGAQAVAIWGTGTPRREFLFVDDMAEACLHVMGLGRAAYEANTQPMLSHINVGSGEDVAIIDLARKVARVVGYEGRIETDPSRPDGAPRKLMDTSRLKALGWSPRVSLEEGLAIAYRDFLSSPRK
ncbi:MAG TPA: GDP-L-fucose synthase [Usitatibacter sp.]|nr:GDP-L-fucose synthase [Usitatibacter sp.]